MMRRAAILLVAACGGSPASGTPDAASDAMTSQPDAASSSLGMVSGVMDIACPTGSPTGLSCKRITVAGCPGIENETVDATIGILPATGTVKGTITHHSGGGGQGFQLGATPMYQGAGFRQVYVAWASDWEQTQSAGIKTAACRPATVMRWIFDELHGGSRSEAFCGEGFSGGSGQLGYALAQYGLGDYFDYVNELSGPPFTRIDLGCDGDAPATAQVCNATVTMRLPARVDPWENTSTCGTTNVPAADLAKWNSDSIAVGGTYAYPKTRVEFFDCTYQATAVTAMAQLFHDQITSEKMFHCYSQADGCQGEGLGTGNQEAARAMIAGCTPRHQ